MGRIKALLSTALISTVLLSCSSVAFASQGYTDTQGHWAKSSIDRLSEYGIISGYDSKFRPEDNITRGEISVIIDRVMGYQTESRNSFKDLDSGFYRQAILRANEAGVISGYDSNVRPKDPITREEAVVMLCRAFHIPEQSSTNKFTDSTSISTWARNFVSAMSTKGYVSGDTKGYFNPKNSITRGEVTAIMDRLLGEYVTKASTITTHTKGNMVINTSGVELKDITIDGDLIIAEGVKDGSITLNNVTVKGKVQINGGGDKALKIKGSTVLAEIEQNNKANNITYDIPSSAKISAITLRNGKTVTIIGKADNITSYIESATLNIEDSTLQNVKVYGASNTMNVKEDSNISKLITYKDARNFRLNLDKDNKITDISVDGEKSNLSITGKVTNLNITENAYNSSVSVNSNGSITTVNADAKAASIAGNGKISRVNANADDITVNIKDTRVYVGKDADNVKVDNKKVKPGSNVNSSDVSEDIEDWDDDDYDRVNVSNVEVDDSNTLIVTLNKQLPVRLDRNDFSIERVNSGSDPSIRDYEYYTSGSKKNKVYTLTTSTLVNGERYELTIELPNGDDIDYRFYVNYNEKEEDKEEYPVLSNISTYRDSETYATISWRASRSGSVYYLIQTSGGAPSSSDIRNNGTKVSTSSGSESTRINGLTSGTSYKVYMVSYYDYYSSVYGPYTIEADKGSGGGSGETEGNISISNFTQSSSNQSEFEVVLSKATKEPLAPASFNITGPKGTLSVIEVSTTDNKTYTLKVGETSLDDGSYTLKVTFKDNSSASSSISLDKSYPTISKFSQKRDADNVVSMTFTSNKKCEMRLIIGKDIDSGITAEEILKSSDRISISEGENTIKLVANKQEGLSMACVFRGNNGVPSSVQIIALTDE